MPKYNLDALGSQEFELMCQSLVQQIIGPGAKIYGMGSDGAREATFHGKSPYPSKEEQWDGDWIFQAKFHDIQQIGPNEARRLLLAELYDELSKITEKYKHPCDNFIFITNVSLTPVYQKGIKDKIDNKIIPKYQSKIKHIHVWGAEEICRFLDACPNIRQTYAHLLVSGDIIACLLKLIERETTDLDELVKLYCQGCFTHEQYTALDDAGDVEDERVVLQRVFIDLDAKPTTLPQDKQVLERLPEWLKQAAENDKRTSTLSYLLDDSILGLVIIGGPGEGKSTLGQYIAQIHRARLIGRLNELDENIGEIERCIPRITFRIILREYAQWISSRSSSDSIFHYLELQVSQESGRNSNTEYIHKIIKSSPTLLILDGLDEVPEKKLRTRVLDNVTSFVNQARDVLNGNLRVVATTRPYGYSEEFDPSHYLHLTLQDLSHPKAILYSKRWISTRESNPRESQRIQDTFGVCLEDRVVSVLTKTPLQVTILLVIIRARGTPPKQREELFERYMDIIYQREQKKRPELLKTERDIIYGLHKYLAYILHRRAGKNRTAAFMSLSEFREKVKDYLIHANPLLTEEELKTKTNQIITEANQRLVLIESSQEGKIGFGLATTREFFAAAHLVDRARDTKEIDLRFKAIARSPHWRNVALFFAGRIGRTRPGEAPSMIDVCREIDTEKVDKFLKRGAELVMEMIDDRVLREPHNEIGAIQYGLTMIDHGFIKESDWMPNKLKSLPDEYKERVIRPWMVERLNKIVPENLEPYVNIYQIVFGIDKSLHDAIKRASEFNSIDLKLWVLSQSSKNRIVEQWVINLLEELINTIAIDKITWSLGDSWYNLRFYFDFSLSLKAKIVICIALFEGVERHTPSFEPLDPDIIKELSKIKPEGKCKVNLLLLWAVSQLLILSHLFRAEPKRIKRNYAIMLNFPVIADPNIKVMINKNKNIFKEFCNTFSKENDSFIKCLVAIFLFLLKPSSERYVAVSKQLQVVESSISLFRDIKIAFKPNGEEMHNYYKDICTLYEYYKSKQQYLKDLEVFNELINKDSRTVNNHPYKLLFWIDSNCDSTIEEYLDLEIVDDMKAWLQNRGFSENALHLCPWSVTMKNDLELCEFVLKIAEMQLIKEPKRLKVNMMIAWYRWPKVKEKKELIIINHLKSIFEKFLENYSTITDPQHQKLEILYWPALGACIIDEKHMSELYKIIHNDPNFPSKHWYARNAESARPNLISMLKSNNPEISHLAAISLLSMSLERFFPHERKIFEETWLGEKYWEFAQDQKDVWRPKYIEGMAHCRLKWAVKGQEWLKAIKEANSEKLQDAWCQVIDQADYCDDKDRDALYDLLIHILEFRDTTKPIQSAALRRLGQIVSEIEPVEFDERPLNLPLPQRSRPSFL